MKMNTSNAKSYSELNSECEGSELSIYEEYSPLNIERVIEISGKENERDIVSVRSHSVIESWNTDAHQKNVLENLEASEHFPFIKPCSISIPKLDLQKYIHQRDIADSSENISDALNSSSNSSFDTRTEMDGIKLELIERYLNTCAENFAKNSFSTCDMEASEIGENKKSFELVHEEDSMSLHFSEQNDMNNFMPFERKNNTCFTSLSSEQDNLSIPFVDRSMGKSLSEISYVHFKSHEENCTLKQCSVVVRRMNADECLNSEYVNKGKKALLASNSKLIENDNLSVCTVQLENSIEHKKDVDFDCKVGHKMLQNGINHGNIFSNKWYTKSDSSSLKEETTSGSSKRANIFDFKTLQKKCQHEMCSEGVELERSKNIISFSKSTTGMQIKNFKNGDHSFSPCEISETGKRCHAKQGIATEQKIKMTSPKKTANFSRKRCCSILEYQKDVLNAKELNLIAKNNLRFSDVPSNITDLEKQNSFQHNEKIDEIGLCDTCEKVNKLPLIESNTKKTVKYERCGVNLKKSENEREIKVDTIRKETKDKVIHIKSKKVLNSNTNLILKDFVNDNLKFNKTDFSLNSSSNSLENIGMNDNAEMFVSYESDKQLTINENNYGLKPCSVLVLKLPLSIYAAQISEYQNSFNYISFCKEISEEKINNACLLKKAKENEKKISKYSKKYKKEQSARKDEFSVQSRKKGSASVSRKGFFKIKPKNLPKDIEIIESNSDADMEIIECVSDVSECDNEVWNSSKRKFQINALERQGVEKNTKCSKYKKKPITKRSLESNKKSHKSVTQEASFRLRSKKKDYVSDVEILEIKSDTSEYNNDKTWKNIKRNRRKHRKSYMSRKFNMKKVSPNNPKAKCNLKNNIKRYLLSQSAEKGTKSQICTKNGVQNSFLLNDDKNSETWKPVLKEQEICSVQNKDFKNNLEVDVHDCFHGLEVNGYKNALKQNGLVRLENSKISTKIRNDDKVHVVNSNSFTPVECDESNKHVFLEEVDEKYVTLLKRYSIQPCVVVLKEMKPEEYQINFENKLVNPYTEKKVMGNCEISVNNHDKEENFKEVNSVCNTSITPVENMERMSYKDWIVKDSKNNMEVDNSIDICSVENKTRRKDLKYCEESLLEMNTSKECFTEVKFSPIIVECNRKSSGMTKNEDTKMSYESEGECNKAFSEEKEGQIILNIEENLSENGMVVNNNIEQYGIENETKEYLKWWEEPLFEMSVNKDISTKITCDQNKVKDNCELSEETRKGYKKCHFKSDYDETNQENKNNFSKALMHVKNVCEETEDENFQSSGRKLDENSMVVNNNVLFSLEEITEEQSDCSGNSSFEGGGREIHSKVKCKSSTTEVEYRSEAFMNIKEHGKEYYFKSECNKRDCEITHCETLVPVDMNFSQMSITKILESDIDKTSENEDTGPLGDCATKDDNPASFKSVAERYASLKSENAKNMETTFLTRRESLKVATKSINKPNSRKPTIQNMKAGRDHLINNFNTLIEHHEPVKSSEMEQPKPGSSFLNSDEDSVIGISTRNKNRKPSASKRRKKLAVHAKNVPVNFTKQMKNKKSERNFNGVFKKQSKNINVIEHDKFKTEAYNSDSSYRPEDNYHESVQEGKCRNINVIEHDKFKTEAYNSVSSYRPEDNYEDMHRREKFTCFQCGKYVNSAKGLFYHICSGKRAIGYLCYFCEKIYLTQKQLELHKRSHER